MGVLRENVLYLLASSLLLAFGMYAWATIPQSGVPLSDNPLLKEIEKYIQFYRPYDPLTIPFLLAKNSLTAAMAFFLGPILLIVPTVILLLNGFMVGMIGAALSDQFSVIYALQVLAPHGIFEIPALVIASAGGIRLGVATLRKLSSKMRHREYSLSAEFKRTWRLLVISVILLLIAAVMETYVTPFIIGYSP